MAEALIEASGVRRSCETAARRADFSSSDCASADACAASWLMPGPLQGEGCLIDEGRQRLLVFGAEDSWSGPARYLQHAGYPVRGRDGQIEDVGAAGGRGGSDRVASDDPAAATATADRSSVRHRPFRQREPGAIDVGTDLLREERGGMQLLVLAAARGPGTLARHRP